MAAELEIDAGPSTRGNRYQKVKTINHLPNRTWLCLLASWLVCGVFFSQALAKTVTKFEEANQRFESADFVGALEIYQKLIAENGANAARFYNLGNCQYQLAQYGPAILSYERAKLITPRDSDLLRNLQLAFKAAAISEPLPTNPKLAHVTHFLSRNEWSWLVILAAAWLGLTAMIFGFWKISKRSLQRVFLGTGVLAILTIAVGSSVLCLRRNETNRGVVLKKDTQVFLSPFEKATAIGTLSAGQSVQMNQSSGHYIYVQGNGVSLEGWLDKVDVAAIESAPTS